MMKMMDCRGLLWYDRSLEYNRVEVSIMYMIFMFICNLYIDNVLFILNYCVRFFVDFICCF